MRLSWSWYPSVIVGFALWTAAYEWCARGGAPVRWWQRLSFHAGTLIALLALVSPLDELGDEYLFSAHMVQHILLMFGTAPLWLIGTPGWLVDALVPAKWSAALSRMLSPLSAYIVFIFVMWVWHYPLFYAIAQENETIHAFEHLMYIGAALIGWWPAAGAASVKLARPAPPLRILYLFLLALPCTALAAVFTFAPEPLYRFYIQAPHPFGLNALEDQHLGGLLMWLPTHLVLLIGIAVTFARWFGSRGDRHPMDVFQTGSEGVVNESST